MNLFVRNTHSLSPLVTQVRIPQQYNVTQEIIVQKNVDFGIYLTCPGFPWGNRKKSSSTSGPTTKALSPLHLELSGHQNYRNFF